MRISEERIEELKSALHDHVMYVNFNKVSDGSERGMYCTLRSDILPDGNPDGHKRKPNRNVVNVWDVEEEGWRSFNIHTVNNFDYAEEYGYEPEPDEPEEVHECSFDCKLVDNFEQFADSVQDHINDYDNAETREQKKAIVIAMLNEFADLQGEVSTLLIDNLIL